MITRGIWLQALILCLCSGCGAVSQKVSSFMGGEDNATPPTEPTDIEQRLDIHKLWDTDIGDGADTQYLKLVPVYVDGRIFVANSEGNVEALDATSGASLWNTELDDTRITGGPGVGENLVLVGTGKAEVITLAADTGKILWRGSVSSEVLSAPQPAGKTIVVRTIDGKIFGLDSQDGKRLWTYEQSVPALTLRGTSSPVIAGNFLIAGFDEGRLAAIELQTGKVAWEKNFEQPVCLSAADRTLLILTDSGKLHIAEASPKSYHEMASAQVFEISNMKIQCWTPPVLCGGRIYIHELSGRLICVDVRR